MLFCPYCLRKEKPTHKENDFTDVAGFSLTDNPNKRKMMLKVHSRGCGRVFIGIFDFQRAEYIACFRLPQQRWVKAIFRRSQV